MILYVACDRNNPSMRCPGSRACLYVISQRKLDVHVQDVSELLAAENGELPGWLDGTPILLDEHTGELFKGTAAMRALEVVEPSRQSPGPPAEGSSEEADTHPLGCLPRGLEHCGDDDATLGVEPTRQGCDRLSDSKITERDLEEFIRTRNASAPKQVVA